MKYTTGFIKTRKEIAKDIESINGQLLIRGSFIHQEIAGVYTFLPLGLRVLNNIENIIRKHMNKISSELLMSGLQPVSSWETTGRLESVDVLFKATGGNKASREKNNTDYVLGSTHEEIITPLVQEYVTSYKELPVALYQIQTKYRNEARAKSGILRGREFRMKDLYSFHTDEDDMNKYYQVCMDLYHQIYAEIGIGEDTFTTLASGGDFTTNFSHEFQTVTDAGEDDIYLDRANKIAYNKEIVNEENATRLGVDFSKMEIVKACEVGNIFPLNTKFSKSFDYNFIDENGDQHPVIMGCYGIGSSRLMGVIVEKFNDEKGIIWPKSIAPFQIHLITLGESEQVNKIANEIYTHYNDQVLWDNRNEITAGHKFADADLVGCPLRVVVSEKSLAKGGVEIKYRNQDNLEIVEDYLNLSI